LFVAFCFYGPLFILLIETLAMPKIIANQLNFHYQQTGEGPDVVLIHGVTGDLSIWFLCQAMGIFGKSMRVTAFDLRGHGYSDVPRDGYTSADQAGDVMAIMDALDIEHAMLVGHSFGAVIATHASILYPDRTDAIVLSDPCFPALRHLEDVSRWGHWQNFREEAAEAGVTLSDEHWYDLGRFFDQVLHLDGERLLRFRQAVGLPGFHRLLRLAETTCGHDAKVPAGLTEELIQSVTQPVLAIFGEHSPFLATSDYLAANLASCVNRLVPGAKHRAPEENGPAFVEIVNEFLVASAPAGQMVRSTQ
jgi:pimeloyl-ACP methyl ester carboxylesterase